jgi:hypothetical protein
MIQNFLAAKQGAHPTVSHEPGQKGMGKFPQLRVAERRQKMPEGLKNSHAQGSGKLREKTYW